jgi:hypothetical protein
MRRPATPKLGYSQSLDCLGFGGRPDRCRLHTRSHMDSCDLQKGPIAGRLKDDLAEVFHCQAAAGIRATLQWVHRASMARTRSSIMASVWLGDGVKRSRSVPLGTVG